MKNVGDRPNNFQNDTALLCQQSCQKKRMGRLYYLPSYFKGYGWQNRPHLLPVMVVDLEDL